MTKAIRGGRARRLDRVFTPENFRKIQLWISQHLELEAICERLGCTMRTLKSQCTREGISLRAGTALPDGFSIKRDDDENIRARVSTRTLNEMQTVANSKGKSIAWLASRILNNVADDDLYAAVLDDD